MLEAIGGRYRVHVGDELLDCTLRGRLKQAGGSIAVGDLVEVERLPEGDCCIAEVLPRHSRLSRHSLARRREQILAANVDQVAAVLSAARPDPDFRLLDRLLVAAELDELGAFVVLNKIDLLSGSVPPEEFEPYVAIDVPIVTTSVPDRAGLETLWGHLRGRITVFTGPSGVGKSSLLNALVPGLRLRVAEVGDRSGRGRHTTVGGVLLPLPGGGYLADTPGIQYFEPGGIDPRELPRAFREFRPFLGSCRFADCRHQSEPACAVRAAVEEGRIPRRRFESYSEMRKTAEAEAEAARRGSG